MSTEKKPPTPLDKLLQERHPCHKRPADREHPLLGYQAAWVVRINAGTHEEDVYFDQAGVRHWVEPVSAEA